MKRIIIIGSLILSACTGGGPRLDEVLTMSKGPLAPTSQESVSATQEALQKGLLTGVSLLHKEGGFYASAHRILIPKELQKASDLARSLGLTSQVDTFQKSLNVAAEKAVGTAVPIFQRSVRQLTFQNVVAILQGSDEAATDYFRKTSEAELRAAFKPIVAQATAQNDVGKLYKQLSSAIRPAAMLAGVATPTVDLDEYVTDQAVRALFQEIGHQEALIRKDPLQRTTDLLQKVFGYYGRESHPSLQK